MINLSEYQEWAETVQKLLKNEMKWRDQYKDYANKLLESENDMKKTKESFHRVSFLPCYVTLGNMKDGNPIFDLRYLGQSVGEIRVKEGTPYLYVDSKKSENSKEYFKYDLGVISGDEWGTGEKAKMFRKFYNKKDEDTKYLPRQIEHMVESRLYQEFEKKTSKGKQILNIQPITFAKTWLHMKTCLAASNSKNKKIHISDTGGEIDIICRKKYSNRDSRLTVIEVKDEFKESENFELTMFQAISYAVFIRELIHSECGKNWMKIWGLEKQYNIYKKNGFTINAVAAMPVTDNDPIPDFNNTELTLGNDKISLHYIALDPSIREANGKVSIKKTSL